MKQSQKSDYLMSQQDLAEFWRENTTARQIPLVWMFEESFLFDILPEVNCVRYYEDLIYRLEQHTRANNILDHEIGFRPYGEDHLVYMKGALEVRLGATRKVHEGGTAWIAPAVNSPGELQKWLERTSSVDLGKAPVPEEWRLEKEQFEKTEGKIVSLLPPCITGPVTLAGNLLGQTEVCMWIMDHPDLMLEFFEVLCTKQIEFYETLSREELGEIPLQHIYLNDDCCCLLSPQLYESFCVPYLDRLFRTFAPDPQNKRRQHSDSAMAHLMPLLNNLGVNEVNFGPTIHPSAIREAMPNAIIHGQMPPMLLRNGSPDDIAGIVQRDYAALGEAGWCESPAGVVSSGTSFDNLRAYMRAVRSLDK